MENVELMVPVVHQFFDEKDVTNNPIKTTVNMLYYLTLPDLA